ncbi:MAG: DUF2231 domain-containing protein [Ignavibacteriaceae bacterium]
MEFFASIHPKVVHFPLAFLLLYPLIELLAVITKKDFYSKTANLFLLIGTLGAFLAVFTGNQAFSMVKNWDKESLVIFNSHQTFANYTMWFFTGLLALRVYLSIKKKINQKMMIVLFLLSLLGCYLVYQTGNYGGKLAEARIKELNIKLPVNQ